MKILRAAAKTAIFGLHFLPGSFQLTQAQTLPPVSVTGPSAGGNCGSGCSMPSSPYYGGGGSSGGGGGYIPESEASAPVPAPAPKTAEQILKDKQDCTKNHQGRVQTLENAWKAEMDVCVNRESTWVGATYEFLARIVGEGCMGNANKWHDARRLDLNLELQACYAKAEKP